jgi:4a-hydroxytetrahydrobiopterin dehydratase
MAEKVSEKSSHDCGCQDNGKVKLTEEEIQNELGTLNPQWKWTLLEDRKTISRMMVLKNWQSAMNAIQEISKIAERPDMQHHPDLHLTSYRNLEVRIKTNAVDALTKMDFILARAIDNVAFEYSPKWLKDNNVSQG